MISQVIHVIIQCPASEPLTEACFQKHPLEFVQNEQAIVFPNGSMHLLSHVFLDMLSLVLEQVCSH